jgi:predicted GIY-YIG superfamily endonuclease
MAEIFYLYILKSKNNKLYIGQTNSLQNRQDFHRWGVASKFTSQNKGPFQLVYSEKYRTRKEAMARERQLKKWSRAKKEALISGNLLLLKKL